MTFESPYYELCIDPECYYLFAYRDPYPELPHWHFIGSPTHPAKIEE